MRTSLALISAIAQTPRPKGQPGGGLGGILTFLPLILVIYYFMLRPQQRRTRDQRALVGALKQGDRVVAAGGIVGTIRRVEDDTVSLQVADNVVLKVDKGSVSRRLEKT